MRACDTCRKLRRLMMMSGLATVLGVDALQGGGQMDDGLVSVLLLLAAITLLGLSGQRIRGQTRRPRR